MGMIKRHTSHKTRPSQKFGLEWSREEMILALALYITPKVLPDKKDFKVIELSQLIGRTPSSVALRLANFRAVESEGGRGMSHSPLLARKVWQEFQGRREMLEEEASRIRKKFLLDIPSGGG